MKTLPSATISVLLVVISPVRAQPPTVPVLSMYEVELRAAGAHANPYTDLGGEAHIVEPDSGSVRVVPLFWDGGSVWKFRFSPVRTGVWKWTVHSQDAGLDGESGSFTATASRRKGSIRPMSGRPHHFERQDGTRFWFMGDTAWALYTDSREERHDRDATRRYLDARAHQGFNVLHSMLLSEAGWGNRGGPPFLDIAAEKLNPSYWQEVDRRLAYANEKGLVCGLALAWGDKRKVEPYAWRRFPDLESRIRYARYIAARYSAYDVYFIVSGEWHAEVRTRDGVSEDDVRKEFIRIGDAIKAADPHGRMIAIHPMTAHGSVREFNRASWMSFGDYQQNYRDLHARILQSRRFEKPVVNSEYGYLFRDRNGDGTPDKPNSTSVEAMRHATWDIVMAGGYVLTGFGTTYFGGNRDPGPFDVDAEKNRVWEQQIGQVQRLFARLEWWKLEPHDELLRSATERSEDGRELRQTTPPKTTYWCLATPGTEYLLYARGLRESVQLSLRPTARRDTEKLKARRFNPRTGEFSDLEERARGGVFEFRPPDEEDWVVHVRQAR